MQKTGAVMATMVLAAVALAACGSSGSSNTSSSSTGAKSASVGGYGSGSGSSSKKTVAASSSGSGVIKMNMVDDAFQPKAITGKAGSSVKVVLKNTGSHEHNFKIDSQKGADADVAPGKTATVTVKIPTSGTVQFYCEYHKGLGMVGTVKPS